MPSLRSERRLRNAGGIDGLQEFFFQELQDGDCRGSWTLCQVDGRLPGSKSWHIWRSSLDLERACLALREIKIADVSGWGRRDKHGNNNIIYKAECSAAFGNGTCITDGQYRWENDWTYRTLACFLIFMITFCSALCLYTSCLMGDFLAAAEQLKQTEFSLYVTFTASDVNTLEGENNHESNGIFADSISS